MKLQKPRRAIFRTATAPVDICKRRAADGYGDCAERYGVLRRVAERCGGPGQFRKRQREAVGRKQYNNIAMCKKQKHTKKLEQ